MSYPQRVAANILPLSVAQTLPQAFEEWSFTNRVEDHEEATETCHLCDQEQLRYHFLIQNALTRHTLWVGSKCILKFEISIFEGGLRLGPEEAKKKLDRLTQQMRLESCLKALERLASSEPNDILSGALDYYRKNKHLTPKFAWVVFWRLQAQRIDHCPSFFKVCLRRPKHQKALKEMPTDRVHTIWPALSSSQRKMAIEMGHAPPPPDAPVSPLGPPQVLGAIPHFQPPAPAPRPPAPHLGLRPPPMGRPPGPLPGAQVLRPPLVGQPPPLQPPSMGPARPAFPAPPPFPPPWGPLPRKPKP